jgi:hypothetical protein
MSRIEPLGHPLRRRSLTPSERGQLYVAALAAGILPNRARAPWRWVPGESCWINWSDGFVLIAKREGAGYHRPLTLQIFEFKSSHQIQSETK